MDEKILQSSSTDIVSKTQELVIFSKEDNQIADDILKGIKTLEKQVNEFFKPMVESAHKAHKEITGKRNSFLDPIKKAESRIKDKIREYLTQKRKEEKEAEAKLQQKAKDEGIKVPVTIKKEEAPKGQIAKDIWKAEVTDKSKVPEKYKVVDQTTLNAIARAEKENASVPGVKFYSEISVSTR